MIEGRGTFDVGGETATLGPGEAVIARAGIPHGVRNDGPDRLALVVVMSPKPK